MRNILSYINRTMIVTVLLSGLIFTGLLLSASVSVIGLNLSSIIGYGLVLICIWMVLEAGMRSNEGRLKKYEPLFIMIFFFIFYLVIMQLAPEFGQKKMPFDSLRAQKSLEAGHIAFFRPTNFYYWTNYDLLLSILGIVFPPKLIVGQILNALCRHLVRFATNGNYVGRVI